MEPFYLQGLVHQPARRKVLRTRTYTIDSVCSRSDSLVRYFRGGEWGCHSYMGSAGIELETDDTLSFGVGHKIVMKNKLYP